MSKRYGLVVDLERCIGCHTCSVACKVENGIEQGSWVHVGTIGGNGMDTAGGRFPNLMMHYQPKLCMHCAEPPCIDACPLGAIYRRDDGIVLVNTDRCDGCQTCLSACPYEALQFDPATNLVAKCTMCSHRIDEGLEPFCVICCEDEAIHFGDLEDPESEVARLVASGDTFVLVPDAGTGPAVHYCPPMGPRGLP